MIPAAAVSFTTPTKNPLSLTEKLAAISTDNMGIGQGTMVSLIVQKVGTVHGSQTFGDDTVHVLLWTGFHQQALAERSHQRLHSLWNSGTFCQDLLAEAIASGIVDATLQDVLLAVQEVDNALLAVLRAKDDPTGTRSLWWKPLVVDGQPVLGAKEYIGQNQTIPQGTIYLDGVKLGERILTPARCPKLPVNSRAKTLIKTLIRSKLPIGLYARYRLSEANLKDLRVGLDAATHAKAAGVGVDPAAIRSLFKIAI